MKTIEYDDDTMLRIVTSDDSDIELVKLRTLLPYSTPYDKTRKLWRDACCKLNELSYIAGCAKDKNFEDKVAELLDYATAKKEKSRAKIIDYYKKFLKESQAKHGK